MQSSSGFVSGPTSRQGRTPPVLPQPSGGGGIMELEHAIGVSFVPSSVHVLPNTTSYLSVSGGCVVTSDWSDVHKQTFCRGHDDVITKMVLSEDGRIAVTGQKGVNADICIWSVPSAAPSSNSGYEQAPPQLIRRISEHDGSVVALSMSPDASIIASVGEEKRLTFFDTSNGGLITHTPLNLIIPPNDVICDIFFGPRVQDNKRRNTPFFHCALVTTTMLIFYQLDPYVGQLVSMKVNTSSFQRRFSVGRYTTNGDFFVLGTEGGDVAVIDTINGNIGATVRVCSGGVKSLEVLGSLHNNDAIADESSSGGFRYAKFGPGSDRKTTFFVGGGDGIVAQVDIQDHVNLQCRVVSKKTVPGAATSLSLASLNGPSAVLLVANSTGSLFHVDMSNPAASFAGAYTEVPSNGGIISLTDSVAAPFTALLPHPSDPERFITAALDGYLRSWNLSTYRQLQRFDTDSKNAQSISCSSIAIADGLEMQLSAWSDGAVRCHDLTNNKLLWTLSRAHRGQITSLALSPSLKYFITGGSEGDVKLWDIRSREIKMELKDHSQAVEHVQLFDDDKHLLTASRDRTVNTWDLTTGRRITSHEAHVGPLTSALLSRNQTEVYTVGHDHKVNVYDLRYKEPARSAAYCPAQCDAFATKIRRSVDERLLCTGGTDQVVKLWDPRNLSMLVTGFGHSGTVTDCGFTCDNRQVLSCGSEGNIMVWNVYA